jgi:hypothetical protein
MRVKISFEDAKKLFNYLDKHGRGELGYDEFSMLIEEKWRGLEPSRIAKPVVKFAKKQNPIYSQSQQDSQPRLYRDNTKTQDDIFGTLEALVTNRMKVPAKSYANKESSTVNINR